MRQYKITGMSCAACSSRVEKAVSTLEGVTECTVNLLTNSMVIEGTVSDASVIQAVTDAGYGASLMVQSSQISSDELLNESETSALKRRLLSGPIFLLILMYFSMGHHMFGWPVPVFLANNHVAVGVLEMILAAIVMVINRKFFISGFRGIIHGAPNMDTLVALGSAASFCWSTYALVMLANADANGDFISVNGWMNELYFESAAMILVLITVGKMLEAMSKGRTTAALRALMDLAPETATLVTNGIEREVPIGDVKVGDIFAVRPGKSIPVDGIVIDGSTAVDESALTGESIPVDKSEGDTVSSATISLTGYIRCRATRVGEDTSLSQIIRMVSDAAAGKAPIANIADRVSGIFVPTVIGISVVTLIIWMVLGKTFDYALTRAIAVLVISCPCALGLATPVAIMVGNGSGARHGILFKTAVALEQTGKADIVVLDKTGTVTTGEMQVIDMVSFCEDRELLETAYSLEKLSEHPIAGAIVKKAEEEGLIAQNVDNFRIISGNGLEGTQNEALVRGGSLDYIEKNTSLSGEIRSIAAEMSDKGYTPVIFEKDGRVLGIIAVADTIKDDSPMAVAELKNMGIQVVMLTGDNIRTAKTIADQAGIRHMIAGVLPGAKSEVVNRLKGFGRVIMVGDGINDAPALTMADTGIAIGAGTDVAIDAADVVLMNSRLSDVAAAIRLSRATLRNIKENLFWAFFYNILCIPLAAGCYTGLFGWTLSPMIAAAAMSLSSFCVVSNALRLNLSNIYEEKNSVSSHIELDSSDIEMIINETCKEDTIMTKTIKIEGMMCPHCEAHTKKALEAIEGVESAVASHTEGNAVVTLTKDVDNDVLAAAVADAGYTVLGVE